MAFTTRVVSRKIFLTTRAAPAGESCQKSCQKKIDTTLVIIIIKKFNLLGNLEIKEYLLHAGISE